MWWSIDECALFPHDPIHAQQWAWVSTTKLFSIITTPKWDAAKKRHKPGERFQSNTEAGKDGP
jgi:hypothetical protein